MQNTKSNDGDQADVVANHLPSGYTAEFDGASGHAADGENSKQSESERESSLKLMGGDVHRDLFKLTARGRLQQRAATFSHPQGTASSELDGDGGDGSPYPTASEQIQPGGFRREYILQNASRLDNVGIPGTRNFVEFLDLYGSFAGEDLAESESGDESGVDEEPQEGEAEGERRPLLGRRKSSKAIKKGDAGTLKTFFTLIKAFVGTGIMFLPKAFSNGGILFSSITMLVISAASALAFHLLLQCKKHHGGGYGELGGIISGPKFRALILGSITLSQLGFVCAGIVFVAENMMSFLDAITSGPRPLSTQALIGIQVVLLVPLAFIRNISKLGPAALLADICILIGVTYIYYYDIASITSHGISETVTLFNPDSYTLTIGSAIFTFEGVGLILPIQSSMRSPQKFEMLLFIVMVIITIVFTSVGALCYATFGMDTKIEIISNYPQNSKLVNAVQCIYAFAVLVGTPVQLFPAMRILENKIFKNVSGKGSMATKWKKNAFRTLLVVFCGVVSIAGAGNLDTFVALIGSFACVPLVYIYPPYLHLKGVAEGKWVKAGDVALMVVGFIGMVYTTVITVKSSFGW